MLLHCPYSTKVDVWSVGIMAYSLLVGDIPWRVPGSGKFESGISSKTTGKSEIRRVVYIRCILNIAELAFFPPSH